MKRLEINLAYGVQFENCYRKGGHPDNIAKIVWRPDARGDDEEFSDRVQVMQEMISLWNAKYASTGSTKEPK
mgnify:CR=1 FL=1|tara:strand:- start:584 stop:799 length:216 start_codon:yes stop_codon:yes gene_type:complete